MHGKALTRRVGRAGKEDGLTAATLPFDRAEDGLVVQNRVEVVHLHRIGAVVVNDAFSGDPLANVGLDCVHAHVEESSDMTGEPLAGGWIGKIHYGHARLPKIGLPNRAVGALDETTRTLGKEP